MNLEFDRGVQRVHQLMQSLNDEGEMLRRLDRADLAWEVEMLAHRLEQAVDRAQQDLDERDNGD